MECSSYLLVLFLYPVCRARLCLYFRNLNTLKNWKKLKNLKIVFGKPRFFTSPAPIRFVNRDTSVFSCVSSPSTWPHITLYMCTVPSVILHDIDGGDDCDDDGGGGCGGDDDDNDGGWDDNYDNDSLRSLLKLTDRSKITYKCACMCSCARYEQLITGYYRNRISLFGSHVRRILHQS